jgi:DNA modification methylase
MNKIEFGDCRETMRRWAVDGVKVQTCVTSPPYFGLRDYGHDGQIGLEQTPEQYISAMVDVFRCVRDVLADDGTLWVNIGDSYSTGTKANRQQSTNPGVGANRPEAQNSVARIGNPPGCKTKDLIGIPWMLAFALRADGWYLRQDIIWHKPNPMPESVRDRCTKAHEYVFLLSKSEKYFFDGDAIRENSVDPEGSAKRYKAPFFVGDKHESGGYSANGAKHTGGIKEFDGKRNKRSVWTVNTKPYKGAHFATFPASLIEPCILSGSRQSDIVMDPFMGSGTTAAVALQHGRQYLGCELNPEYGPLQQERINKAMPAISDDPQLSLVLEQSDAP